MPTKIDYKYLEDYDKYSIQELKWMCRSKDFEIDMHERNTDLWRREYEKLKAQAIVGVCCYTIIMVVHLVVWIIK